MFPPHTSHQLQHLERPVYGPFKKAYNAAMDGWSKSHPGRTVTIYDISTIVAEAQLQAMAPQNIKASFAATSINPCNRDIFTDADFAVPEVTDRPHLKQLQALMLHQVRTRSMTMIVTKKTVLSSTRQSQVQMKIVSIHSKEHAMVCCISHHQ